MAATKVRLVALATLSAAALLGSHAAGAPTRPATSSGAPVAASLTATRFAPAKLGPVPSRVFLGRYRVSVLPTARLKVWGRVTTGSRPRASTRLTVTTISRGVTTRTLYVTTTSTGTFVAYVPAYLGEWVRVTLPAHANLLGASAQEAVTVRE